MVGQAGHQVVVYPAFALRDPDPEADHPPPLLDVVLLATPTMRPALQVLPRRWVVKRTFAIDASPVLVGGCTLTASFSASRQATCEQGRSLLSLSIQGGDKSMLEVGSESRALPIIPCVGPPEERGAQHGEALREQIAQGIGAWSEAIAERHDMDPDAYIRQFVQGTNFLDSIRRWTPDLEPEIAGIARGANQPWEWIYAYNLLDEEWTWARRVAGPGRGCTAVGLTPGGSPPLLAQTMDIPRVHDGTQAVLRLADDTGLEVTVFTYAGMMGLTGCNSAGVALVVNNLDMLPGSLGGLPVGCVIRGILQRTSLQAATDFALQVPHATGQHYGMAAPDGVASVEGWANGVATGPDSAALLHTNHPLYAGEPVGDVEARYQWSRTRERLAFVQSTAGSCQDVPGLQRLLADRTVPVSLDASRSTMTFGAVIYECSTPPQMWVTPGPPHQFAFHHVSQERTRAAV